MPPLTSNSLVAMSKAKISNSLIFTSNTNSIVHDVSNKPSLNNASKASRSYLMNDLAKKALDSERGGRILVLKFYIYFYICEKYSNGVVRWHMTSNVINLFWFKSENLFS